MNEIIIKRIRSFAWRFLCVALVAGLSWAGENLVGLGLPVWAVGIVGLLLGEVSKWFRDNTNLLGKALKR